MNGSQHGMKCLEKGMKVIASRNCVRKRAKMSKDNDR